MPVIKTIRANGWRQGAIAQRSGNLIIERACGVDFGGDGIWIVVTQDCDIVHDSLENEPYVEVLYARLLENEPDGNFVYARNPRRLHIAIKDNGAERFCECKSSQRFLVAKELLANVPPAEEVMIPHDEIEVLRNWLAARYKRSAFPDEFMNRLGKATKRIRKLLSKSHHALSGIYVALNTKEELDGTREYELAIYGAYLAGYAQDAAKVAEAESVVNDLAIAINDCDGICVVDHLTRPEDKISLDDLRYLERWEFDYLSFKDGGVDDIAPQV